MRRAAIVINPVKFPDPDRMRTRIGGAFTSQGWAEPLWLPTTEQDPGIGQARRALVEGVDLVCPLGGDGTVRNTALPLIGTDTPLGLVPSGTGNLLARNLGIDASSTPAEAVRLALGGRERRIDVGVMEVDRAGDGTDVEEHPFLVMCGMGIDAEMLADTPDVWKKRLGWVAYVVNGVRHLRTPPVSMEVTVDDRELGGRATSTVIIGNCGRLTGGVRLMPRAQVDDGLLDAVVLAAGSLTQWGRMAAQIITRRSDDRRVQHLRCTDLQLRSAQPRTVQVDGDIMGETRAARVRIRPQSLTIRVPSP